MLNSLDHRISRLIVAIVAICLISAPLHGVSRAHAHNASVPGVQHASDPEHTHKPSEAHSPPSCCYATCTAALVGAPVLILAAVLRPSNTILFTADHIPPAAPLRGIERPPKDA